MKPIIDPVPVELLKAELTPSKKLEDTNKGHNELYIVTWQDSPNVVTEIGRLRELVFRDAGGSTGNEIDLDEYDKMEKPYKQLIVWDPDAEEIIGGYRFIFGSDAVFDENGQQLITEKWKDGYCRVFFKDGSILCEGFFINRDRVGLHKFYFHDGGVQIEEYYRRGVQHGLSRVYNKNGSIKSETQYVDGVREGIAKYYDQKKGIICEYPFHDDKLNGVARSYCDGRLFGERTYENGVRQGYAQYFDSEGRVYKKSMYVDDEYCGSKRLEYEGDVLIRECDMAYDRPEGEEVSYNDNGNFRMRVWYKNGMVVDGKYEFFEDDGSLGGHVEFRNNRAIESDAEGHLRVACDFYRDEWNGRCVFYDAEEGERECYFIGEDMYETREEFLDATFEHMAGICLARFARRLPEYNEETYKAFFAEAYDKAMNSPAAQVEYNDYAELENPGSGGISDERFPDYVVREFMLRLRLPNDGETEREIVKGLKELVGR